MIAAVAILPSHKKVAWAWLDNMLDRVERVTRREEQAGRPQTAPADLPRAVSMTPRARKETLQDAYEDLKKQLIDSVGKTIPTIRRKEGEIARRHGLDEIYFDWFIMAGRHWPSMSSKMVRSLRAIQAIYTWYGEVPSHWNNMVVPEMDQARDRDRAMKELADWFVKTQVPKIERDYVRSVSKKANELVKTFKGRSAPRDPKAALLLMRDFEKRLLADRYPKRAAIQAVVNLFE